ncbi:MAG: hypothetical protein M3O66_01535 [Verrucomicrobiota bacterium]|jgi:hypothetical protein|nr:hypothetical protein [Verrucomicrobiota bacterium]
MSDEIDARVLVEQALREDDNARECWSASSIRWWQNWCFPAMNTTLKWKPAAGFLLVFIAGGMTGVFIWSSHARHLFLGPPHSGALAHRMGERLRSEPRLTPDQFTKIAPIIDQNGKSTRNDPHRNRPARQPNDGRRASADGSRSNP